MHIISALHEQTRVPKVLYMTPIFKVPLAVDFAGTVDRYKSLAVWAPRCQDDASVKVRARTTMIS